MIKTPVIAVVAFFAIVLSSVGEGLDWRFPREGFDGVNRLGQVSFWTQVGEIDFGNGFKLPLNANFSPAREDSSPYLGDGWWLPLLESGIVAVGDREFRLVAPDGRIRLLRRETGNENRLHGDRGWSGAVDGDTITVRSTDGGQLVYESGKLVRLTSPVSRTLILIYSGNRVTELLEKVNGKSEDRGKEIPGNSSTVESVGTVESNVVRLKVERTEPTDEVSALVINGVRRPIKLGDSPGISPDQERSKVVRTGRSLVQVGEAKGDGRKFAYSVNAKGQALFQTWGIPGRKDGVLTWDRKSRRIIRDGEWAYRIEPGKSATEPVAIIRTDAGKKSQSWMWDEARGFEESSSDENMVKYWYYRAGEEKVGRLWKLENWEKGVLTGKNEYAYDDFGRRLIDRREHHGRSIETFYRYEDGLCYAQEVVSGDTRALRIYDADSYLLEEYHRTKTRGIVALTSGQRFNFWEEILAIYQTSKVEHRPTSAAASQPRRSIFNLSGQAPKMDEADLRREDQAPEIVMKDGEIVDITDLPEDTEETGEAEAAGGKTSEPTSQRGNGPWFKTGAKHYTWYVETKGDPSEAVETEPGDGGETAENKLLISRSKPGTVSIGVSLQEEYRDSSNPPVVLWWPE